MEKNFLGGGFGIDDFRASINEVKSLIKAIRTEQITETVAIKLVLAQVEDILSSTLFESVGDKLEELFFYHKEIEKQEKNSDIIMQEVAKIKDKIEKLDFKLTEEYIKNMQKKSELKEIKTILKNLETITIDA